MGICACLCQFHSLQPVAACNDFAQLRTFPFLCGQAKHLCLDLLDSSVRSRNKISGGGLFRQGRKMENHFFFCAGGCIRQRLIRGLQEAVGRHRRHKITSLQAGSEGKQSLLLLPDGQGVRDWVTEGGNEIYNWGSLKVFSGCVFKEGSQ